MGILDGIGASVIKPKIWQLEVAKLALEASPVDVLAIPRTAVQELTGVTDNLQNFLLRRAFNLPQNDRANVQDKPPQPTEPTYPGAPLFSQGSGDTDEVDFDDVNQGNFGDCYLMASLAAIARDDPQAIRDMVRENRDADGNLTSYTVTFQERDNGFLGFIGGGDYNEVEITVSPSEVLTEGANPGDNGELWVKVIEAAFAEYKGGVDEIKNGGNPSATLQILTGNDSRSYDPDDYSFESLETDFGNGEEIVLSSIGDDKKLELGGYGIHGDHAYMVENVYTDADGNQMVQLYNPWGHDHPKPIPFGELEKYFSEVGVN